LLNNLLLTVIAAMVLIGTLYPLLVDALGAGKISVGPPYFGTLFALLLVPLIALLPLGFSTRWQSDDARRVLIDQLVPIVFAIAGGLATAFLLPHSGWRGVAGVTGGVWILSTTIRFYFRCWRGARPTRSQTGMCLAHFGIGVFLIGAALSSTVSSEKHLRMNPGDVFEMASYEFEFAGTHVVKGPNYMADQGEFTVYHAGEPKTKLYPQKRRYLMGGQVMTEAAIDPGLTRDLYVSLGEPLDDEGKSWAVRIYHKPFVRLIWLGALFMMTGGLLAATDRRYRRPVQQAVPASTLKGQELQEGLA
jgi:cytochrome c-type biogenesis protein CcmF